MEGQVSNWLSAGRRERRGQQKIGQWGNDIGIRKPLRSHRWQGQPVGEGKRKQRDKADRARRSSCPGRWAPHEGNGGLGVSRIGGKWARNAYSYAAPTVFMK